MIGGPLPYHGLVVAAGNGRSAPVSLYAYAIPLATPRLRSVPDFRLCLDLSDHIKAIEEGLHTDGLRIINSTSLRLWITCRAKVLSNVRAAGPFDEMAIWAQFTSGGTGTAGTDAKEAARCNQSATKNSRLTPGVHMTRGALQHDASRCHLIAWGGPSVAGGGGQRPERSTARCGRGAISIRWFSAIFRPLLTGRSTDDHRSPDDRI
jgi:hypothetical protein